MQSDIIYQATELRNDAMYTSVDQVVKAKIFNAITISDVEGVNFAQI